MICPKCSNEMVDKTSSAKATTAGAATGILLAGPIGALAGGIIGNKIGKKTSSKIYKCNSCGCELKTK